MKTTATSVPFEDLHIGDEAIFEREVTEGDVRAFASLSGDTNPMHLDEAYARTTRFGGRVVHGALASAHLSAALATQLPGPGTIYLEQSIRFRRPTRIGDVLTTRVRVVERREDKKFVRLSAEITNQSGEAVATGEALVLPPEHRQRFELPDRA
ncbi:MAG: MaoC family dehydratase [Myxococcota bacterium]